MRRDDGMPVQWAVGQQFDQHRRVKRHAAARVGRIVDAADRREVQRIEHVAHEEREVTVRQPRPQVGRQQQLLVERVGADCLGHSSTVR